MSSAQSAEMLRATAFVQGEADRKLAADVTAQVKLLIDLKSLTDLNIGAIDKMIDNSVAETQKTVNILGKSLSEPSLLATNPQALISLMDDIGLCIARSKSLTEYACRQMAAIGENTLKLGKAAQALNDIIEMIRHLVCPANLLALDAAIDAARAAKGGVRAAPPAHLDGRRAASAAAAEEETDTIPPLPQELSQAIGAIRDSMAGVRDPIATPLSTRDAQNMLNLFDIVLQSSRHIDGIACAVVDVTEAIARTPQARDLSEL